MQVAKMDTKDLITINRRCHLLKIHQWRYAPESLEEEVKPVIKGVVVTGRSIRKIIFAKIDVGELGEDRRTRET